MNEALIADPVRSKQILERIPAGRWGTPEDFEGAIVYLASKASDYVSGECLVVDGGWMGSKSLSLEYGKRLRMLTYDRISFASGLFVPCLILCRHASCSYLTHDPTAPRRWNRLDRQTPPPWKLDRLSQSTS